MIENPQKKADEVKDPIRRKLLQFFFRRSNTEEDDNSQQQSNAFIEALSKAKVSRRTVLAASAVGGLIALEHGLNGLPSSLMREFLKNPERFLEKFAEKIQSGEIINEISQAIDSRTGTHGSIEMGETVNVSEDWIDQCFAEHEVRKVIRDGKETDNLLLIAEVATVKVATTRMVPLIDDPAVKKGDFSLTMQEFAPAATLPSTQVNADINTSTSSPYQYSAYQQHDGSIIEYFEMDGERRERGGGLVVVNGVATVVSNTEIGSYAVGKDGCQAIETFSFTISSETKVTDLLNISNTEVPSGADLADSPRYDSVLVTFKHADTQETQTFAISTYQHLDKSTMTVGKVWDLGERMSPIQAAEMCDRLMVEKGFSSYIIAVPDPEEQSRIISSETYTPEQVQALRAQGVALRIPTERIAGQVDKKIHRTVGMEFPIEGINPRKHFLVTTHIS